MEILVDGRLDMSLSCALATKKASILGCIKRSMICRVRKVIVPLFVLIMAPPGVVNSDLESAE